MSACRSDIIALCFAAVALAGCNFDFPQPGLRTDGGLPPPADADTNTDTGVREDAGTETIDAMPPDVFIPDTGPPPGCGDGQITAPETCDDDNVTAGDGCSPQCTSEPGWSCTGTPSVCTNPPPTAVNDAISTPEDAIAMPALLANDQDDFDDVLEIIEARAAAHGTTSLNGGVISYQPEANYFGPDSFLYVIRDSAGATSTATVTVTVTSVDDAPVANDVLRRLGFGVSGPITVSATDLEGDPLMYFVDTRPANGRLSNETDGNAIMTYAPNAGFSGVDTFTYYAQSGATRSNTATVTVVVLPADWRDAQYQRRRRITINNAATTAFTNFPVLITFDAATIDYSIMRADGADLRFFARNGPAFDYEVEQWTPNGTSLVWVEVPSIASSTTTAFYVYYGNPIAMAGQDREGTWEGGYTGVWHLAPNLIDSRTSAAATNNGSTDVTGVVGRGRAFDGSAIISLGANYLDANLGSASFWARVPNNLNVVTNQLILYGSDTTSGQLDGFGPEHELHHGIQADERHRFHIVGEDGGNTPLDVVSAMALGPFDDGDWHHVFVTWQRGAEARLYIDGTLSTTENHDADQFIASITQLGGPIATANRFIGDVDEVRISSVLRDGAWVAATWRSMADPNFLTIGPEDDGTP
jgi:cysteine-rich repeat protein